MKLIILKENLNKGLNIVSRVAGKNLTLPILNNILISTEKNFLNLASTDLELGIKYWSLVKTEKEGEKAKRKERLKCGDPNPKCDNMPNEYRPNKTLQRTLATGTLLAKEASKPPVSAEDGGTARPAERGR